MKVRLLKTGEAAEVNASYGVRLIEHGMAVPIPESKKPSGKEDSLERDAGKGKPARFKEK